MATSYKPHFFDKSLWDYKDTPDGAKWMDDVWINGHLARRDVPRLVVPFDDYQWTYNSYLAVTTLDRIRIRRHERYRITAKVASMRAFANDQALDYFSPDWEVLWESGYRLYSDKYGITSMKGRDVRPSRGAEVPHLSESVRNRKPKSRNP